MDNITETGATSESFSPHQGIPLVLLVEDEEYNILYFRHILTKLRVELRHVDNGLKAVEFCRNNPAVKLVLMDIRMPVMDGLEATRNIREFLPDTPIVALTAYGQIRDEIRMLTVGFTTFLSKPVPKEKLSETVLKYLAL